MPMNAKGACRREPAEAAKVRRVLRLGARRDVNGPNLSLALYALLAHAHTRQIGALGGETSTPQRAAERVSRRIAEIRTGPGDYN
jgi:hypothetical protein